MVDFKKQWNVEMALDVMQQKTADSTIWAEAVKWLLLYGPPDVQKIIQQASGMATRQCFPNLKSMAYSPDDEPCYDIKSLAESLGLTERETLEKIQRLESQQQKRHLFSDSETSKIH